MTQVKQPPEDHADDRPTVVVFWARAPSRPAADHRCVALAAYHRGIVITQDKLARLAHCSRQSANEYLAELEQAGLIVRAYRKINIPSLLQLEAYAHAKSQIT